MKKIAGYLFLVIAIAMIIIVAIGGKSYNDLSYSALIAVGMTALIRDDLCHVRNRFKMTKDEVSRSINMGEALMNVLGVMYTPAIFMCISSKGMELYEKIVVLVAVAVIVVELNHRIYKYKERLRSLEKTE